MLQIPSSFTAQQAGNVPLDNKTFIFFALRPDSKLLSTQDRTKALALSILMGFLTLGIGHLVCKIICEIKKHQLNSVIQKAVNTAQKVIGCPREPFEDVMPIFYKILLGVERDSMTEKEVKAIGRFFEIVESLSEQKKRDLDAQIKSILPKSKHEATALARLTMLELMDKQLRLDKHLEIRKPMKISRDSETESEMEAV